MEVRMRYWWQDWNPKPLIESLIYMLVILAVLTLTAILAVNEKTYTAMAEDYNTQREAAIKAEHAIIRCLQNKAIASAPGEVYFCNVKVVQILKTRSSNHANL